MPHPGIPAFVDRLGNLEGLVLPVDEFMDIRNAQYGQVMVEGDLEGLFRQVVPVGHFDTVQLAALDSLEVKLRQGRDAVPLW